jgi:3-hydroxyacyl-[acyl-carrier-protein] dehydratase
MPLGLEVEQSMRFALIDRITELDLGSRLTATKGLTLSEEYLQDHFPLFPVMPGVLMLEALFQASAWLVRLSEDFAHSVVQLREAKNVRFADFVEPGQLLTVRTTLQRQDEQFSWLQAEGQLEERGAVKARLVLERFNLADRGLDVRETDALLVRELRDQLKQLYPPAVNGCTIPAT